MSDAGPTPSLMKEINAAFNSRDVDRIMSLLRRRRDLPDGARPRAVRPPRARQGRDRGRSLADRFKVIPDMRWDHVDHFVAGNRAVSVWMVTGKGGDGELLNYQGCDIYEFRGDKILNKDTYWKIVEQDDRL